MSDTRDRRLGETLVRPARGMGTPRWRFGKIHTALDASDSVLVQLYEGSTESGSVGELVASSDDPVRAYAPLLPPYEELPAGTWVRIEREPISGYCYITGLYCDVEA